MLKPIFILLLSLITINGYAQGNHTGRAAILMIHYGTTNAESRSKTIDPFNHRVDSLLSPYKVMEAYSSQMVIDMLKRQGIEKMNPIEALQKCKSDGYKRVVIQSSNILDGIMTDLIEKDAREMKGQFDTIMIGKPLLWNVEDCRWIADLLVSHIAAPKGTEVILVGHGTVGPADAMYTMLDYVLHDKGYNNYHVATIEGYPNLDNAIKNIKNEPARKVILYPLLMIAGNHVTKDISGRWKHSLENLGYQVEVRNEGLAGLPEVQNRIISQIKKQINQ